MKLHIYYVQTEEEAKQIREQYKMIGEKVYVIISGKENLKENLKDFLKSR
jgi:KaiC/GvpD/RAD55 family RecA-like ATPase